LDTAWTQFLTMPSTMFATTTFRTREVPYQVVQEASSYLKLGVRAAVLAASGSLCLS
jgi:hypothetical protein